MDTSNIVSVKVSKGHFFTFKWILLGIPLFFIFATISFQGMLVSIDAWLGTQFFSEPSEKLPKVTPVLFMILFGYLAWLAFRFSILHHFLIHIYGYKFDKVNKTLKYGSLEYDLTNVKEILVWKKIYLRNNSESTEQKFIMFKLKKGIMKPKFMFIDQDGNAFEDVKNLLEEVTQIEATKLKDKEISYLKFLGE